MLIGDTVTHNGRRYVVVGCTPMSVRPFAIQLHDPATDQRMWVQWPLPEESIERAALRVVPEEEKRRAD